MNKFLSAAAAVTLLLSAGACMQQSTSQELNTTNANSRIYIGSLNCNVAAGTGYVLASSKGMDCVFIGKDGVSTAQYTGTITKIGVDVGYTKAVHTIWRVYSLGSDRAANSLAGSYVGEQGTVAAGGQAGGNWLYGGPNAEIGMIASGIVQDAGYNLALGIGSISLKLLY